MKIIFIHPFRAEDLKRFSQASAEVYNTLSDSHTLKFVPGKRLNSIEEAETFLKTMLLKAHTGRNYLHFITDKKHNRIVGLIDLISPELARQHYRMDHYPFFIEFYLSSFAIGCYLMTNLLPPLIDQILNQGVARIGAVVNRDNIAAKKVLRRASFQKKRAFDMQQDFYEAKAS